MTRRRFLTALSIAGVGSVLGVEGLVLGPHRLTITRHQISKPGKESGTQLRIVQLTDLHLRELGEYQERVATEVNALDADIVVLTGDSIDQRKRWMCWVPFSIGSRARTNTRSSGTGSVGYSVTTSDRWSDLRRARHTVARQRVG